MIGRITLAMLCLFGSSRLVPAQTVVYQETFGNSGSTNYQLNNKTYVLTDWQVYWGATGSNGTAIRAVVSNAPSKPGSAANVGTNQATMSEEKGCIYTDLPSNTYFFLTSTETGGTIDLKQTSGLTFSWYQNNNDPADGFRLAVQIDGSWYVTRKLFSTGPNVWDEVSFSFVTDSASWRALNFTPKHALSLGAELTTDLPSGNITGFGLYTDSGTGKTKRFDTFSVSIKGEK